MCNLCCLSPPRICWRCQARRPPNSNPCKYCYAEQHEQSACSFVLKVTKDNIPPPPPVDL